MEESARLRREGAVARFGTDTGRVAGRLVETDLTHPRMEGSSEHDLEVGAPFSHAFRYFSRTYPPGAHMDSGSKA